MVNSRATAAALVLHDWIISKPVCAAAAPSSAAAAAAAAVATVGQSVSSVRRALLGACHY